MNEWWITLTQIQKMFWGIAIFSSIFFTIQMILTFVGLDGHGDTDFGHGFETDGHTGDTHSDSGDEHGHDDGNRSFTFMGYFTVRNLVAFFLGFSWGGLTYIDNGLSNAWSIILAVLTGLLFSIIIMALLKVLSTLKNDGTMSLKNAIGKEGIVSIRIPANMDKAGKISISFQNRLTELDSVTKGEEIRRGQKIKVIGISGTRLLVDKI